MAKINVGSLKNREITTRGKNCFCHIIVTTDNGHNREAQNIRGD